jgi:hypothetical protein
MFVCFLSLYVVVFVLVTKTWGSGHQHAPAALHLEVDSLVPSELWPGR